MISDLKICLDAPLDYTLEDEQRFIYTYGSVNCRILKFKDANTVIKIMNEFCLLLTRRGRKAMVKINFSAIGLMFKMISFKVERSYK